MQGLSEKNINTTDSIKGSPTKKVTKEEMEASIKRHEPILGKQKVMKISIPKSMSKILQDPLYISVNGVSMSIPIDGEEHLIPEVLYNHAKRVINKA